MGVGVLLDENETEESAADTDDQGDALDELL